MSQENVEIVRRHYAALAARDWTVAADLWHPDIELETLKSDPEAGTYRGFDEITTHLDTWSEPYSEYRVEAKEIIDAGDRVVAVERVAARGLQDSHTDTWLQQWLYCLISVENGKISRVKEYSTRADALEAAGLRE